MKSHVLKHTVCAPKDIIVLHPANHSTCAKEHRVLMIVLTDSSAAVHHDHLQPFMVNFNPMC